MPLRISKAGFGLVKQFQRPTCSTVCGARRTFMTSTLKRPSLTQSYAPTSVSAVSATAPATAIDSSTGAVLDLLPKISTHPALAGLQVRNGPRNTTFNMTHFKRKRRVGFLARKQSRTGRKILVRRMLKRRTGMSH